MPYVSVCLLVLLPFLCMAEQLHFEVLERTCHPTVVERVVTASFPFTNSGTNPVTILELKTSCGCTTAELEKKTYGPGESGEISATFTIGDRTGQQIKLITVRTDEAERKPITLRLEAMIPEGPSSSSRFIDWYVDGGSTPKTVIVTLPDSPVFVMQGVKCADNRFHVTLAPGEDALHYLVTVSPGPTTSAYAAVIDVVTDLRTLHLYARILDVKNP